MIEPLGNMPGHCGTRGHASRAKNDSEMLQRFENQLESQFSSSVTSLQWELYKHRSRPNKFRCIYNSLV